LKQGPSTIPIYPGDNLLGLYNRATPVSLDNLNLVAAGFTGGPNSQTGDIIRKVDADGISTTTYFYLNLTGFEGWYTIGYQPSGHITVAPGSVFMLYRQPAGAALEWTLPSQ
jgi:hypothetical protein